jgi:hypothetical protein
MADRRSLNSDKIIEDLRRQIRDLKYNNDQLSAKVKKMETVGRRPSQLLLLFRRIGQQRRCAQK